MYCTMAQDETPLFLAAREGSYEACKALLDNFANREITDHMDRLPRDVAGERLHHDIVRLLDEHVPRSPQMVTVIPSGPIIGECVCRLSDGRPRCGDTFVAAYPVAGSPGHHHHLITHPTVIGAGAKPSKSKKRPKAGTNTGGLIGATGNSPTSPDIEGAVVTVRRKPSVKKSNKKLGAQAAPEPHGVQSVESVASPITSLESPRTVGSLSTTDGTPSPYDSSLYSNGGLTLAQLHHAGLDGGSGLIGKQPPSYEDCIKGAASMQSLHNIGMDSYGGGTYGGIPVFHEQGLPQQHGRQTSLPLSIPSQSQMQQMQHPNTLSPPYSNQQSPPHSVNSSLTMSPPTSYMGSPSPAKSRPSLPTSPTHIAAMRAATHQKHGGTPQQQQPQPLAMGFDFSASAEVPLGYGASQQLASLQLQQPVGAGGANTQQQHQQQQQQQSASYYHYLTPPSQHSQNPEATPQHYIQAPENFPTPSPESPGHWSSSSPHSNSDWSEGIHSPVANAYVASSQHQKQAEAIYI